MLAVVDAKQVLKVIDHQGTLMYRVQLPPEGQMIFLGWEDSGRVLAAVQKLGGAFLWFPAKPDSMQQWEGMQFSSKMIRSGVLKSNSHFDTSFASWSVKGKLVLGLADGNFACWDLGSNETFMSRKHFAGKHKGAITCGAWGPRGEQLALGSFNQLKVSQPLLNASWEHTAAKLLLDKDINFQQLKFSASGQFLAAFGGSSVFRHLGVFLLKPGEKEQNLIAIGEMQPSVKIGALQAMMWLEHDVLAVVTSKGFVRLLQYDKQDGSFDEDQYQACGTGVADSVPLSTGHIAMATLEAVAIFDPLSCTSTTIPLPAQGSKVRLHKMQAACDSLIISRSDGLIFKVPLADLPPVDLSLVVVRGRHAVRGANGSSDRSNATLCAELGVGTPKLIMDVSVDQGATSSRTFPLNFAYSPPTGLLAMLNSLGEIHILDRLDDDPSSWKTVHKEGVPTTACVYLEWDPSTQKHLALAMRGNGVALWEAGANTGMQMWSGMQYKNSLFSPTAAKSKEFDPMFARWSRAGMLALGMADGGFAVWDSVSQQVFVSQRSGRHKSAVTAGDWISSLFSPCLALASKSTIKVSQGFDGVEWPSTAMKLKLGTDKGGKSPLAKSRRNSDATRDTEALTFLTLSFSAAGKYLAALAAPTDAKEAKQVVIYSVQDQRNSLEPASEVFSGVDGTPFKIEWLADETLVVFRQTSTGGGLVLVAPKLVQTSGVQWPLAGSAAPGRMLDGAVAANGLIAAAFELGVGGVVILLSSKSMTMMGEIPMQGVPRSITLQSSQDCVAMAISFESGGVQVWHL